MSPYQLQLSPWCFPVLSINVWDFLWLSLRWYGRCTHWRLPVLLRGICPAPVKDVLMLSTTRLSSTVAAAAQRRPRQPVAERSVEISLWVSCVLSSLRLWGSHFWAGTSWTAWCCQGWLGQFIVKNGIPGRFQAPKSVCDFSSIGSMNYVLITRSNQSIT